MKFSLLVSAGVHIAVLLLFVGINVIFPKDVKLPPRVILNVELAVDKAPKAKKTQVKKTNNFNQSKTVKKKPKVKSKPKPKVKPKLKVKSKPKPKVKPKLKVKSKPKPKLELNVVKKTSSKKKNIKLTLKVEKNKKARVANKTQKIDTKKLLKTIDPKKPVVTEKDAKKTTTSINKKNKKIINDVKKSHNKSKTSQRLDGNLTKDDLIGLRDQLRKCWKVPAGVQNASDLVTKITVFTKKDGTVELAKILYTSKSMSNPFMEVMAESAIRAILSPECNPLNMPKEKYKHWKKMEITFDPKKMFN